MFFGNLMKYVKLKMKKDPHMKETQKQINNIPGAPSLKKIRQIMY